MKTRSKPNPSRPKAAPGPAGDVVMLPVGAAQTIALNLPEFAAVAAGMELPPPNRLSPLPALTAPGAKGRPRPIDEVMHPVRGLDADTLAWAFGPLAIPDRVLDMRGTPWNGAPALCRFYANRLFPSFFAGLRPAFATDYEIIAPFTAADFEVSTRIQVQVSAGQPVPPPAESLSGEDLAFLLLLADAYKAAFAASWTERSDDPRPLTLSASGILAAQAAARASRDRRWAARAIGELFEAMLHVGGGTGVGLPQLDARAVAAQLDRYARQGMLQRYKAGRDATFELGATLGLWAGSLMTWLNLQSLHDVQVTGESDGRLVAQEDCLVFIVTDQVIWTILSEGLNQAGADIGNVRFNLRSLSMPQAAGAAGAFVQPLPGVDLPADMYVTLEAGPNGSLPAAAAQPPPPPPRKRKAARWAPTHTVPDGGLDAWDEPDPDKDPVAQLDEGLEVEVTEEVGAWAHIVCDNGWEGWTDARELETITG